MNQETSEGSLHQRLGGIYPIAAVVDDFIDRIMVDPRLNAMRPVETDGYYGGGYDEHFFDDWLKTSELSEAMNAPTCTAAQKLETELPGM